MKLPDTIRGRTIWLLVVIAVLPTLINFGIILSRPPPREAPLTTFEIARLLQGLPVAKTNVDVSRAHLVGRPVFGPPTQSEKLIRIALARDLGAPTGNVLFQHVGHAPRYAALLKSELEQSFRLYGRDRFEGIVAQGFRAAVKTNDGGWQYVGRQDADEFASWRSSLILRLLVTLILILPLGWMFARWLTDPINAFANAAEQMGRDRRGEEVAVRGSHEIRQAAVALNDMQRRIRGYVLERTSMIGAIAHDLRTPLSRLKYHLAMVPDDIRRRAEIDIDEMEQMISASLDFADAEGRPMKFEPVDLSLLVEGVVDDLADLGKPVELSQAVPTVVIGDQLLLKRLFTNVINNAVTYGKSAKVVVRRDAENAFVDVDDEGPGLDRPSLDRAFEPFYRGEVSRNRSTGGMGLGLAIVRSAANAHGGDASLQNLVPGGLRARIRLPLALLSERLSDERTWWNAS